MYLEREVAEERGKNEQRKKRRKELPGSGRDVRHAEVQAVRE